MLSLASPTLGGIVYLKQADPAIGVLVASGRLQAFITQTSKGLPPISFMLPMERHHRQSLCTAFGNAKYKSCNFGPYY